jgi:hypothetical protein
MRAKVHCEIDKWLSDQPQPGWVEAHVTDAHGKMWRWHDKPTTFSAETVGKNSNFPVQGEVRCEILSRSGSTTGDEVVSVRLIDIDEDEGNLLEVYGHQLVAPE